MDNGLETIFKEIIETEKQIERRRVLTVETRNRLILLSEKLQEAEAELYRMNALLEDQVAHKVEQEAKLIELSCRLSAIDMCQRELNEEVEMLKLKVVNYQDNMVASVEDFHDHVNQVSPFQRVSVPKNKQPNHAEKLATLASIEQHLMKEVAYLEVQHTAASQGMELTSLRNTLAGLEQILHAQKLAFVAVDKEVMLAKLPQEDFCRLQKELDAANVTYSVQQKLCDNLRSQLGWSK